MALCNYLFFSKKLFETCKQLIMPWLTLNPFRPIFYLVHNYPFRPNGKNIYREVTNLRQIKSLSPGSIICLPLNMWVDSSSTKREISPINLISLRSKTIGWDNLNNLASLTSTTRSWEKYMHIKKHVPILCVLPRSSTHVIVQNSI